MTFPLQNAQNISMVSAHGPVQLRALGGLFVIQDYLGVKTYVTDSTPPTHRMQTVEFQPCYRVYSQQDQNNPLEYSQNEKI